MDISYKAIHSKGFKGLRRTLNPKETVRQIHLSLTLLFNEQWEKLHGGRIKFGLKGGILRLTLTNGQIPIKDRGLASELPMNITRQRTNKHSQTLNNKLKGAISNELKLSLEAGIDQKEIQAREETFEVTLCQVTIKGADDNPAWVFEEKAGEYVLKGSLKEEYLGVMSLLDSNWKIDAKFEVLLKDVFITDGEGIWIQNLTSSQRKILDIALAKLLMKHKFVPYLSKQEIRYV